MTIKNAHTHTNWSGVRGEGGGFYSLCPGGLCLTINPRCQGMYSVCYLRQRPVLTAVCTKIRRVGDILGKLCRSVYVYVLEAAKLPCVLIAVFWLPRYYYVTTMLLIGSSGGGGQKKEYSWGVLQIARWLIHWSCNPATLRRERRVGV